MPAVAGLRPFLPPRRGVVRPHADGLPRRAILEEALRTDETSVWGTGLHISQNISLAMLVGVAMLWVYILRQPRGRAFGTPSAA